MLGELAQIALAAVRAYGSAAVATAKAEQGIVSEDWFVPEVGRARACGARDAAESLQKVSRALRLTLMLEMNVAEIVRDIQAGKVTYIGGIAHRKDAAQTTLDGGARERRDTGGSLSADGDADRRVRDGNTESLVEFDRPDVPFHAPFRATVEKIAEDVDATIDWRAWKVAAGPVGADRVSPLAPHEPARRETADTDDSS